VRVMGSGRPSVRVMGNGRPSVRSRETTRSSHWTTTTAHSPPPARMAAHSSSSHWTTTTAVYTALYFTFLTLANTPPPSSAGPDLHQQQRPQPGDRYVFVLLSSLIDRR